MAFRGVVTLTAREPTTAAFEFDRNDIKVAMVMAAARVVVDNIAVNLDAVDRAHLN
jgi:hypothetical protein